MNMAQYTQTGLLWYSHLSGESVAAKWRSFVLYSALCLSQITLSLWLWLSLQTSFTLTWAVYMLALNKEVQQEIYEEVLGVVGPEETPTADHITRLPLVRGLVKETLRLFPVLPGNGRVTQDDLVVGGYFIPKGTQLALCHYSTSMEEENFPDAGDFRPARWVRKDNTDRVDNFGSIPFGYGLRSCIGRRVAELEMHLALARLIQRFNIDVSPLLSSEVKAKTHGLLCPAAPVHIRFRDRDT